MSESADLQVPAAELVIERSKLVIHHFNTIFSFLNSVFSPLVLLSIIFLNLGNCCLFFSLQFFDLRGGFLQLGCKRTNDSVFLSDCCLDLNIDSFSKGLTVDIV